MRVPSLPIAAISTAPIPPAAVRSVLVLTKHRYIGDTIVATPLLRAARAVYPNARIRLAAGPAAAAVLEGFPDVDEVLTVDSPPGSPARSCIRAKLRQMLGLRRRDRPDVCLVADRSFGGALAAWASGGRVRAGFETEGRGFLLTHPMPSEVGKHEAELCLDLLRALVPETTPGAYSAIPRIQVTREESVAARTRLAEEGMARDAILIGMQPASKDAYTREWSAERFAWVADRLNESFGARVVLLGAAGERRVAQRVAAEMRSAPPLILAGETSIREALALIDCCRLWIGNDGGLLHAAVALGRATIGVFAAAKAVRWGYSGPRNRTLFVPVDTGCASVEDTMRRGLDALTPEAVADAAAELLGGADRSIRDPDRIDARNTSSQIGCMVS